MTYNTIIGMEVHVELKTNSKMFSGARNDFGTEDVPNTNIDPVVNAEPGALPVPNRTAIAYVQKTGLALGCEIARNSKFDRKNYFYPDLPKGYQISQFDQPLCGKGAIDVDGVTIGITRIHMEEDTGKNIHSADGKHTLVDLNRAGLPLMELVTEPDITSPAQARAFCQRLQQILRYLGVSDADIEKGQMRCEVNLSLYKDGEDPLSGTKVEVKNIGSLRAVEKAAAFEIERQTEVLEDGGTVDQETRGWDGDHNVTVSQRKKEDAHDYRYFPEPDIAPMTFSDEYIEELQKTLPEMPAAKRDRLREEYDLSEENLDVITADKETAQYFEYVASEIAEKKQSGEFAGDVKKAVKTAANYIVGDLQKLMSDAGEKIAAMKMTAENFAELICMTADGKISSSATQAVLAEMFATGGDPSHIVDEKNLAQENDTDALEEVVTKILADNEQSVADYKAGKDNALKFLMGHIMKETKGKANPQMVSDMLKAKLSERS